MGDGSLAFAPQWLKAGNTSLRSGTQGGSSTNHKEEGNWRDTGSRLGLGAGAEREGSEPKSFHNQFRRPFVDRSGPGQLRGGERSLGTRPSPNRLLSDRELVEQTSSLGLKSGRSDPDSKFSEDSFGSLYKEPFTPRGTSTLNGRKSAGSQRNSFGRGHDRDFGALNRSPRSLNPHPHSSLTNALLSPRQELKLPAPGLHKTLSSPSDQPWTSRLADSNSAEVKPPRVSSPLLVNGAIRESANFSSPPSVFGATNGDVPEAGQKSAPRMADAIAQAQASAAQEQEALKAEKLRKEQLALRQSKQLVPVLISGKHKQSTSLGNGALPHSGSLLLRKSPGLDLPKTNATATITTSRREEEIGNGLKKGQKLLSKPTPAEISPLQHPPKVINKKPSRDKDRSSFFSSLRSISSSEVRPESEISSRPSQDATNDARSSKSQPEVSENSGRPADSSTSASRNGSESLRHESSAEPEILAQEVAFMKSLGWDGDIHEDDTEGGLTEEEIAAFYAEKAQNKFPSLPAKGSLILKEKILANGNGAAKLKSKLILAQSFHSAMEFSDSDSE